MFVSIVVPAYNEERRLGACLDSILAAVRGAEADAEIIVVDNASTDRTAEVARSRPGVTVVHEPSKGLLFARQKGFTAARGELLACIDADSLMTPRWMRTAIGQFERSPRLVCLSGPYHYNDITSFENVIVMIWYLCAKILLDFIGKDLLRRAALIQGGNYAVRRSALARIGGYDTSISFYGEDTNLACRIARVGKVRFMLSFRIATSGRRLRAEGLFSTGLRYALNALSVVAVGRPSSGRYTDIREPSEAAQPRPAPAAPLPRGPVTPALAERVKNGYGVDWHWPARVLRERLAGGRRDG
jgi:glycosyltransferase involved in cell wall biosynthesis